MQIEKHNTFLDSILTHAKNSDCHYKKYLPDNPPKLHPTEVTSQTCIIPSNGSNEDQFLKLIKSHYDHNGIHSSAVFDLRQLEQDVVKFYIAGKPLITVESSIRIIFRFRNSPTETTLLMCDPACPTHLSAIAQELPTNCKVSILLYVHVLACRKLFANNF